MNRKLLHVITVLFIVLLFGLAVAAGLGLRLTPAQVRALGTVYYVDDDTCPASGSGTQPDPYCRIQTGVDAASDGDEIRVAAGTYTGTQTVAVEQWGGVYTYTQVVIITKSLTLQGGYAPDDWYTPDPAANPTVIDAERQGRGVSIVGTYNVHPQVTVDGFTITGGDYTGLGNPAGAVNQVCRSSGGSDCGGGLYAYRSVFILRNSVITGNVASSNYGEGGGIYLWQPSASRIENTTIISNSADMGGGICVTKVYEPVTITQSTFRDNYADGSGGGLALKSNIEALVTIAETGFLSNTAQAYRGGGVYAVLARDGEKLRMDRVRMSGNEAGMQGAAVYLRKVGNLFTSARLTNLLLTGNRPSTSASTELGKVSGYRSTSGNPTGAVIAIGKGYDFDVTLAHLTAAGNPAPTFLWAEAPYSGWLLTVTLTNTLVTSATNGFVGYQGGGDGSLLIRHTNTLTDDVATLHHTEAGSPTFEAINPLNGDPKLDATYHLLPGSAAIDAGVDAGVETDIDGDVRPQGDAPDIGADEFLLVAPASVSISGPTEGIVGETCVFTATVSPPTATLPITYTWSPTPASGQGEDTATYTWAAPGAKTISVTAENVAGAAPPGMHNIAIAEYQVYLPLVLKN